MIIQTGEKGKVVLKCEDCGAIRNVQRNVAIMQKKEHPCVSCSNKRNGERKKGIPSWNSGKRKKGHEIQKGSKYTNHHGYIEVYVGEEDAIKHGRKGKYVLEHRMVMQNKLGRLLEKGEIVHHINGNKVDNREENLFICKNNQHHIDTHKELEEIAYFLMTKGLIQFDNGHYLIAPQYRDVLSALGENGEHLSHNKQ